MCAGIECEQIIERMNTDVELKLQTNRILAPNSLTSWLLKFSNLELSGNGGWGMGVEMGVEVGVGWRAMEHMIGREGGL